MTAPRAFGIGVIGLGVMGKTHVTAWNAARAAGWPCQLVAVCDRAPERLTGEAERGGNLSAQQSAERLFDPAVVQATTDPGVLLGNPRVDIVSICTRTPTHVDLALEALAAGKHVLVEKPLALTAADAERLLPAARRSAQLCLPAHCMRFWPGWTWLRDAVSSRRFGRVRSATFQRLASPPAWARDFYGDPSQTGGALIDLHLHDADVVRWLFGDPASVVSTGSIDHLTTLYRFGADGPEHVVAEGAWDHTAGFGFRMRYTVIFESATADFDFGRTPRLILAEGGEGRPVELDPWAGYDGEVRHLLDVLLGRIARPAVTVEDACAVARLLDHERESLAQRREIRLG